MDSFQNSLTSYLCAYAEAMFKDIKSDYARVREWERDKTRLIHEIREHGSQVLTIALPAVAKSLDQALDAGLFTKNGAYLGKPRKGEVVPVFLRDLFQQVFIASNGVLRECPSLSAIKSLRQLLMGGKKLLLPCSERRVYAEVSDFYTTERNNRESTLRWDLDDPLSSDDRVYHYSGRRVHLFDGLNEPSHGMLYERGEWEGPGNDDLSFQFLDSLDLTQRIFDWVAGSMGDFSDEGSHVPKHGPGAVADLKTGANKYQFKDWPSKLDNVYPYDMYATHDFMSGNLPDVPDFRNHEVPSKLISVPKTQKSPRLIAAEPSSHQWIQQLLRSQLEASVKKTELRRCITFGDQRPNQDLALLGSVHGDYVTIDLSSASDRLTCWLVERFSRSNVTLLDRLHASRTRMVHNGIKPDLWQQLLLRKFSTMGSAVIFPLQTIIYSCLAIAAVVTSSNEERLMQRAIEDAAAQVRVFGDDIIVPRYAYKRMLRLLHYVGLKVNHDKTFVHGNFRESCGVDAFRGVDVTPTYLRTAPECVSERHIRSLLEVSNNFWRQGYWHTATWLDGLTARWSHLIPVGGPGVHAESRFSFVGSDLTHLKKRWDDGTQQMQVRTIGFIAKKRRTRGTPRQDLLQWFTELPVADLPWEAGADQAVVEIFRPGWQSTDNFSSKIIRGASS